ncbi:hypothetical protein [Paludisphaera rhizosphaerae]|uniref:hypothetical protein n=1 Tax=Paludisphaera rhizosphaerae TaxID=2711216 RepID=UPI0013E9DE18|nr:hypothetical protein [Paludisphaera rhizosphaerae]
MPIMYLNGIQYDTDLLNGYGYNEIVTAGTGEQLPRLFAMMVDLLADASRLRTTTSATSKDAGLSGPQAWVLAADVSFAVGSSVRVARTSDPANVHYDGVVVAYDQGTRTLTLLVRAAAGSATGVTDWTVSVSGAIGPIGPAGNRNRLVNGAMAFDQRNVGNGLALTNSTKFAVDRWFAITAGSDMTSRRVATGDLDFPHAARLQRTVASLSASTVYLGQVVESANCRDMAGQQVTLSFHASKGADFSAAGSALTVQLLSGTGADQGAASLNSGSWTGFSTAAIDATAVLTGTRTRYSFTGTIPAGAQELAVRFNWTPVGTAGAADCCDVTGVQLEIGAAPTPYERRHPATELALCQRYFEKSFPVEVLPASGGGSHAGGMIASQVVGASADQQLGTVHFRVAKRAAPTVALMNPINANAQVRNLTATLDCSAAAYIAGEGSFNVGLVTPAGSSAGQTLAVHWAADAELT